MEENRLCDEKIVNSYIASLICFAYFVFMVNVDISNIKKYLGAIIVWSSIYALCSWMKIGKVVVDKARAKLRIVGTGLLLTSIVIWFCAAFIHEEDVFKKYMRHKMPVLLYLLILVVLLGVVIRKIRTDTNIEPRKWYRFAIGLLMVVIETRFLYAPNIIDDIGGGLHHANAYINTILNVQSRVPFEIWSTSIYGHYGLFYFVPVGVFRVLGMNKWVAISLTVAIFGFITFVCQTLIINHFFKNNLYFTLAILANAVVYFQIFTGEYYQGNPHRYLFPSIILFLCLKYLEDDKNKKKFQIIIWGMVSLSIIWNVETGIICAIVSYLCITYKMCAADKVIKITYFIKNTVCAFLSACVAYVIPNLYNIIVGGTWNSVLLYIYPIGSREYHVTDLEWALGLPYRGYFLIIVIFCVVIVTNITKIFSLKIEERTLFLVLTAIMGLGVEMYFFNRAVSTNMSIGAFEIVLVLVGFLEIKTNYSNIETVKLSMQNICFYSALIVCVSMCLSTVGEFGIRMKNYEETNGEAFEQYLKIVEMRDVVYDSEDVAFLGFYSSVYAALFDVNSQIHTIDFEDMNPQGLEKLKSDIETNNYKNLFVNNENTEYVPSNYEKVWDGEPFSMYERKE